MINLAYKDIRYTLGKFLVTAMGVGMLLGIVLIMIGVYRGMIADAAVLIDDTGADLWVVQEDTLGPFAQASRVHEDLKNTLKAISGIDKTGALAFLNLQIKDPSGKLTRVLSVGYEPHGEISAINPERLVAGRALEKNHYEIVVPQKMGFLLGDRIKLGRNMFTIVGLTKGAVSSGGDFLVYLSLKDAQELQFLYSNARIRNERARGLRGNRDVHLVNAIVATLHPGSTPHKVADYIRRWKHKNVFTTEQQHMILAHNVLVNATKQIGMFTAILLIVSTVIIALIIYTMTIEKIKEIAVMKLVGIPNSLIIKMIIEETLILGTMAFFFANIFAHLIYDKFPKHVLLLIPDAWKLLGVVIVASILASIIGVRKAINANPMSAIGG